MLNRAVVLDRADRRDEAEAIYREVVANDRRVGDDRGLVLSLSNLGGMLGRVNRNDEARQMLEESVAHARRTIGADHPAALIAMQNLGALLQRSAPVQASELMREVVERSERVLGPGHRDTIAHTRDLVLCLMAAGQFAQAEPVARSALKVSAEHLGPLADLTANLNELLAASIGLQGRLDESIAMAKAWYESLISTVGMDHALTRRAARLIAECYDSLGDDAQEAHWRSVASAPPSSSNAPRGTGG
jgi:tetratricopeptide (TPR) repeat protein